MSSVEPVEVLSDDLSTHRWRVTGLQHLNRKNKHSSLPFWVPNSAAKKHQFRCMLIRGMVAKKEAADDWIGLVVEFIPPPTGSSAACPGGCSITARIRACGPESTAGDIEQTETVSVTLNNLQVCFPELVPPTVLTDPMFAEGDGPSVVVELSIQTGVNVATEWANKTVSRVWTSLSTSISTLVQKVSQLYGETREEYGTRPLKDEQQPGVPWEQVPEKWAGREEAWRRLIAEQIVEDEGTFRYGPNRGFSKDEQALLVRCGLNQRLIANVHSQFDYDRDVHKGLLEPRGIRQQRYNLVPGKMKEEVFWANYFWKVAALSLCVNDEQVRLLLTVLNAPPAVKARDMSSIRSVDKETVLEHIKDAQEASDMLIEYLTDDAPDGELLVEAAATACEGHAKQLDGYFKRTDLPEETLKLTGAVLKRVRERLAKYAAWKVGHNTPLLSVNRDDDIIHDDVDHRNTPSGTPGDVYAFSLSSDTPPRTTQTASGAGCIAETSDVVSGDSTKKTVAADAAGDGMNFPLMPWEEDEQEL